MTVVALLVSGRVCRVSDLIHCQDVVERILRDGTTLGDVEVYIERCPLDDIEKAGLWMLAWAHQDQSTQLRLAKEMLALVSSVSKVAQAASNRRAPARRSAPAGRSVS